MLNRLGKGQLRINTGSRVGNIALQGVYGGVDVIGQFIKFHMRTHIDHRIQLALGDGRKRIIDLINVVHHQQLDQHKDHDEQRGEHHNLHGRGHAHGHIARQRSLAAGHHSDNTITFDRLIHAVAALAIDVGNKNLVFRHGACVNPQTCHIQILSLVAHAVADDIPRFIHDNDAAAGAHMAVAGDAHNKLVNILLETFRTVTNLNETAALQSHTGILAEKGRIMRCWPVILHVFRTSIKQADELSGLFSVAHIIAHEIRMSCCKNDALFVDDVDLRDVVPIDQFLQRCIVDGFHPIQIIRHLMGQLEQILVRRIADVFPHIRKIQSQQVNGIIL